MDKDGVPDACDVCPDSVDNVDVDGDGVCDFDDDCLGRDDQDSDGIPDACDPCPLDANATQCQASARLSSLSPGTATIVPGGRGA